MSSAAETYVKSLTHPKVKGGTRRVLDVIAQLIPEGETTTPLIAMQDIATPAGLDRSTVWRLIEVLVGLGLLQVLDRASGKKACYHLVALTGAPPITTAPLPLVGATPRPRKPRPASVESDGPGLFDDELPTPAGEQNAINLLQKITGWLLNLLQKITGWEVQPVAKDHRLPNLLQKITGSGEQNAINLLQKITGGTESEEPVAKDHRLPALPLDVDDARAGAIRKSKYVVEKYEGVVDARAREVEEFLDWFAAEYASVHQGARCTIERAADGLRVKELLDRGRTIERLKAMTLRLWHVTTDGVVDSNRWYIAERATVRNIWLLHRKADFLDIEVSRALAEAPRHATGVYEPQPAENVWTQVLPCIERKINRHSFWTWFQGTVLVSDGGDVLEVTMPGANSAVFADWLTKHYSGIVQEAIDEVRPGTRVCFVVVDAERRKYG